MKFNPIDPYGLERKQHSIAGGAAFKVTQERRSETFDWDAAIERFKKMMKELGYR